MPFNPTIHHRRSIRLPERDYSSPGAYFITIATYQRIYIFGIIADGEMHLNEYGLIVDRCWRKISNIHPNITIDEFAIMPNHLHGIIVINDDPIGHDVAGATHGVAGATHGVVGATRDVAGATHGVVGATRDVAGATHGVVGATQ